MPFFIFPGTKGEQLPNGTLIHIVLVDDQSNNLQLTEFGILNAADSNVAAIQVTFKAINGNEFIVTSSGDSLILKENKIPSIPIREILVRIVGVTDESLSTKITFTLKGCIKGNDILKIFSNFLLQNQFSAN